jgi:hypothetical protein
MESIEDQVPKAARKKIKKGSKGIKIPLEP